MAPLDSECAAFLTRANEILQQIANKSAHEVEAARRYTTALALEFGGPIRREVLVTRINAARQSGGASAFLYRRSHQNDRRATPLIVFFHGGGWAVGGTAEYDAFLRSLASLSGASFLSIDYRLAPEHIYPAAHDDCFSALEWAFCNASALCIDPLRIAVMGDSAGAHLAVSSARRLHAIGEFRLCAQYLLYPFLDLRDDDVRYPSRRRFGDGQYLIGRESIAKSKEWYFGAGADCRECDQSPILIPDVESLPPTIIATAGFDPLADEGETFAARLTGAGVSTVLRHFEDTIHGFLPYGALRIARLGQSWLAEDIRWRMSGIDDQRQSEKKEAAR